MSQLNPMDHSRRKLVILLGEGNFSFAVKLATQFIDSEENFKFIATDYVCDKQSLNKEIEDINDKLCDLNIDERIQDNIRILSSHPHFIIWLDVDATNLDSHQGLRNELSNPTNESVIFVFNFPHVKNIKMKIHLNRKFLADIFRCIESVMLKYSQTSILKIYLSLCYGQSGLNQVEPIVKQRKWADSWQLTEMAAYGNFILTNVFPFQKEFIDTIFNEKNYWAMLSQYEHNRKTFTNYIPDENFSEPKHFLTLSNEQVHQTFGYRLQNQPFNQVPLENESRFQGGNVFTFEYRDDILTKLNCNLQPKILNQFDDRILKSYNQIELKDPKQQRPNILSTKQLYPKTYERDFTICVEVSEYNRDSDPNTEDNLKAVISRFFGPCLQSIKLKNFYIKSSTLVSYCFSLKIQSLDYALNRFKLNEMMKRLDAKMKLNFQSLDKTLFTCETD